LWAGPGGAVLALLLARQGVRVLLLEAHNDFDRDCRGDTIHPSTLELLDDLGLYEKLLDLPHATFFDFPTHFPDGSANTLQPVSARHPRIMDVPQARFIDMLIGEAQRYPTFQVQMAARVEQVIEHDGVVRGVRYRAADGWHDVRADLVVGADGRFSKSASGRHRPRCGLAGRLRLSARQIPGAAEQRTRKGVVKTGT
jgi:2-polyprenyl-6-methoxyphenol hydroxylase-like FAD-dependent oxidoreductase